ncbi:MAG: hypothetical protein APF76_10685 [Desulfitibacter sp. BRH_c19]|nr:MAG: hypothetical protein APF76_10685 [Desulfitibacter sp. BRH_c19]
MAASIYILGLMGGMPVYGIITVLKLKKEEAEHFTEIVLAKPAIVNSFTKAEHWGIRWRLYST